MISINATLVVQIINFLILIWILNWLLFKPIFRIIEEREKVVEDSKAKTSRLKSDTEIKLKDLELRLGEARASAALQKQEALNQADSEAERIMDRAREQAREHISSIQIQSAGEAERAKADLEEYKEHIIELVCAKVLGRSVS